MTAEFPMQRALRHLAEDGFESLGTFDNDGALVVGDPGLLSDDAPVYAPGTRPGRWHLLLRAGPDGETVDELVAFHEDVLRDFYDAYDAAELRAELPVASGRLAILDADLRDDLSLRKAMFEPDELPWVLDRGVVSDARPPARVYQTGGAMAELLLVAFGPAPVVPASGLDDQQG